MPGSTRLWHSKIMLCFYKKLGLTVFAMCPNQKPFVHVTDETHAVAEFLCTGVPVPGFLGLISQNGAIGKYGHLHRSFVSWQMAEDLLSSKLQKRGSLLGILTDI